MSPRVLGVIPARGGSKRVPGKNLRMLCGKPLIQYTIDAVQAATKLTTFVVSTEDQAIGRLAANLGCYVVRRPDDLADDEVTSGAVCKHALEWMEAESEPYDIIVCLHPTSPIRDPKHIDEAIDLLAAAKNFECLASMYRIPPKPHANVFSFDWRALHGAYVLNASIYAMKRDWLIRTGEHVSSDSMPLFMDRRHSIDINEEIDLKVAELYLNGD